MELTLFFRALLRRWYLVAVPLLIVGAYTTYQVVTAAPPAAGFTTVVRFSAAQSAAALPNASGDFQDVWLASELTVKALTSWAQTSSFKREVARRAAEQGVRFDPEALPVAADQERSVGQLFLSWHDADALTVIANAALDVLREESQQYFPQFGEEPAQVTVLDEIRVVPQPAPLLDAAEPLLQLALAGVVGVALALLAAYLDPTLHNGDEVESLGLEVIASVPNHD